MAGTNEAFSRVKIDAQLRDQGWDVLNTNAVRFEYVLPDKTKADYVLCDRHGRALAVIEAKKAAINPGEAEAQAKAYAAQLKVPYVFLANGEEIRFWEWQREAFPRTVKTFFSQDDLERRTDRNFKRPSGPRLPTTLWRVTGLMLPPSLGALWLAWQIGPPAGFGAEPLAVAGPPSQRSAPPAWRPRRPSLQLRTSGPLPARSANW
jgi:type I restriction enzyme R subunit